MRQRVADARVARLATVTPPGAPHVVPCCFVLDGDVVYSAVDDVKPKSTLQLSRLANVAANPAAALLVDYYDDDWSQLWWIRLDCEASVLDASSSDAVAAQRLLAAKYEQYAREPPPGAVLALESERWRAWP